MKTLTSRLGNMQPVSRWILKGALLISNALMLCSVILMWFAGPVGGVTYEFHAISQAMRDTCLGVLFIAVFGSAFIEEQKKE